MKISPFTPADIEEAVALARDQWAESRFSWLPFDETKLRANLERMANSPASSNCAIVARNPAGRLVGYLAGTIEEYFFCRELVASSVFLFVDPQARGGLAAVKLILAFRQWALNRGAVELYMGIASGVAIERTGRFLERFGFRHTGGNYSLWLTNRAGQARREDGPPPGLPPEGERKKSKGSLLREGEGPPPPPSLPPEGEGGEPSATHGFVYFGEGVSRAVTPISGRRLARSK